jgi:hypothetical protein
MLAPRPKVDPANLADTEAQEDSDADATNAANDDANGNSRTADGLRRVLLPVETRPTGVTTVPSATPSRGTQQPPTDSRPRRVLTNTP